MRDFFFPYRLEHVPPGSWIIDGRVVDLSAGWRLKRKPEYPMLNIRLGTIFLGVTFRYELTPGSDADLPQIRATYCELHRLNSEGKTDAIVARTRATCAHGDTFRKEAGRKLALARALKQYGLTRVQRTSVWLAYHKRPRPVSKQKVKVQPAAEAVAVVNLDETFPGSSEQQADGFRETNRAITGMDYHAGEAH